MRVYHFIDQKFGLQNLRNRRLKVSTIEDLNDPFEIQGISFPTATERHAYRRFRRELSERCGLLCFSRSWHNPVQWSHYADRHRGVCLGFDVADELLVPVTYHARLYKYEVVKNALGDSIRSGDAGIKLSSTKYIHWKYEQEVRVFTNLEDREGDLYFVSFSDEIALREVIVGHRCPLTRSELADALGDQAVATSKARLSFKTYSVVTQRDQSQWR